MRTFGVLTVLSLMLVVVPSAPAEEDYTSLIRVTRPSPQDLRTMAALGVDLTEARGKTEEWLELPVSSRDRARLGAAGVPFTVIDENMEASHRELVRGMESYDALGFGTGSMGGHYTYWEVAGQLDSMRLLYPGLISAKQVIGTTLGGRAIWAVKISDNPDVQEDEPEVLYTALIHAREPAGMMSLLYYMWHLLEGYQTNPEAAFLVNNRQLWFIPVVNADGYEYNRKFYPSGGGMRRKNFRNVDTTRYLPSTYGVDLNRNFGTHEMWNSSYGGSSDDPLDDTYRGTIEWSEPETAALRAFALTRNLRFVLNYHTYGDYLIYPWGYQPFETRDSLLFREFSAEMTRYNGYLAGRSTQTVGYTVRGAADDFFYGDTAKPKSFSLTPEVGDRFWARPQDILPFAQENLHPNLFIARMAGSYTRAEGGATADAGGDGYLDRGERFRLRTTLFNGGLADAMEVELTVTPLGPAVTVDTGAVVIPVLSSRGRVTVDLPCAVAPNAVTGVPVRLVLRTTDAGGAVARDTLTLIPGRPTLAFTDSAAALTGWTAQSPWGLTTTAHSAPRAFTDSPSGTYGSSINTAVTLTAPLNLTGATSASLTYWTRWDIEKNWDFARVEVSTNNGTTWASLQGRYTRRGSGSGTQADTSYGLDGTQLAWVEESMDLSRFLNRTIRLRFRLTTDGSVEKDGWYVDDIRVTAWTPNADTGLVVTPSSIMLSGITGSRSDLSLVVRNFTGGAVTVILAESTAAPLPPAPEEFTTLLSDPRGDVLFNGADLVEILSQKRTTIFGTVLDLRARVVCPDSALGGIISFDTDQEFATGVWPTPFGLGPRGRDAGSEFELVIDASGTLADSLGLGAIPIAVLFRTADTTIAGLPIIPALTRDSLLTITVSGIPFSALGLNDPDQNVNVTASFARLTLISAFPDFAPNTGHAVLGTETGASWVSTPVRSAPIAAGDSAAFPVSVLAARPAGTSTAHLLVNAAGRAPVRIPVSLTVSGPGNGRIALSIPSITDTVDAGDSAVVTLTVGNTGTADLFWGMLDTAFTPWLSVFPPGGLVEPGGSADVTIRLRSAGIAPGTTVSAALLVVANDTLQPSIPFPVTLRVNLPDAVRGDGSLPEAFAMPQNYPNPFNPSTTLRVDLPEAAPVRLAVLDILGREVALLADGRYHAGRHDFTWDARQAASGVYFAQVRAGNWSGMLRMLLLR